MRGRSAGDEPVGSLRFGARRRGSRGVVAVLAMLVVLVPAIGTTVTFGRGGSRVEATPRLVATPAAQVPTAGAPSPAPSLPSALARLASASPRPAAAAPRPAKPCPKPPASLPTGDTIALTALYTETEVFDAPDGRLVRRLPSPTRDNQPLHMRAVESVPGWYRAQMAERPNGVTGWVRMADVSTSRTPYRILIERCARRLTLFQNGVMLMQEPVAVGKGSTPTPLGDFYVDFLEKWAPSSKYGPWLISVSGFSEVYTSFGKGGIGQIGIHGTQARTSVGRPTSNGCVRMHNEDISKLARWVTAGTPVLIVA
ncbi:MAG TPA: L,D-transpeptidase [Mycobacteriales bacterium]|nr:L,D-transpeptidase [Mycobacteriales bacterium]